MGAVNLRLTEECRLRGDGLLRPVGCVNPMLPDWQEDLRRCQERYGMKAIRLHPNYHGYRLDDNIGRECMSAAAARGMVVQIAAQMEDERTQHSLLRVAPVSLQVLPSLTREIPRLRVQVLNHPRPMPWERVYWDFCAVEGVRGLTELLKANGADSLCFGSYYPFFLWESAALKMKEAGAEGATLERLRTGSARALLGGVER